MKPGNNQALWTLECQGRTAVDMALKFGKERDHLRGIDVPGTEPGPLKKCPRCEKRYAPSPGKLKRHAYTCRECVNAYRRSRYKPVPRKGHGYAPEGPGRSPTYICWMNIKRRCVDPNTIGYHNYGARGIFVCNRWLHSFPNFLADMGERPEGCSIDRIDNDGPYSPENCRWATWTEQMRNTRRTRLLTFRGETMCLNDWAAKTNIHRRTLASRLAVGWPIEDALTRTPHVRNRVTRRSA